MIKVVHTLGRGVGGDCGRRVGGSCVVFRCFVDVKEGLAGGRSEERRVGKECAMECRRSCVSL